MTHHTTDQDFVISYTPHLKPITYSSVFMLFSSLSIHILDLPFLWLQIHFRQGHAASD
jgi:hypothetical protein